MAKLKKPLIKKLGSLLLFLSINIIVFNASAIFDYSKIAIGITDLSWNEVEMIDIDMDKILGNRPQVFSFNENIIVNSANEIYLYDIDGKLKVRKEINSDTTKLIGMEEAFLVADFVQGNIAIIDYLGTLTGNIQGLGNIEEIVSVKDNMFAIILNDGNLKIFDMYGVEVSSVSLPPGEFLSVDVSRSEELILVTLLSSDELNYNSKMITYSMDKESMIGGINNVEKIVYRAKILGEDVVIFDHSGIYAYKLNEAVGYKNWEYERNGELITFEIDQNGNSIEIINKFEAGIYFDEVEYHLIGMNKDGVLLYDKSLPNKFNKIALGYGKILVYNDSSVLVFNSDGEIIAERQMNKSIYNISWLSETRLLIEYNDLVEILDLAY